MPPLTSLMSAILNIACSWGAIVLRGVNSRRGRRACPAYVRQSIMSVPRRLPFLLRLALMEGVSSRAGSCVSCRADVSCASHGDACNRWGIGAPFLFLVSVVTLLRYRPNPRAQQFPRRCAGALPV